MAAASIAALTSTQRQLGVLYNTAGTRLGAQSLWRKVGATPMLGQNDQRGQVFTLQDADRPQHLRARRGVGRMSVWSLNRDQPCSVNYPDITRVNDSCSGFAQGTERFAALAGADDFTGTPQQAAGSVTTPEPSTSASAIVDDPATSPYPIWNELSSYPAGTKIVLRGNVYEAKWWTRGDVPDDPVLQEAQTPWRLIGPVLPGETPVPVPTLPAELLPDLEGRCRLPGGQAGALPGHRLRGPLVEHGDQPGVEPRRSRRLAVGSPQPGRDPQGPGEVAPVGRTVRVIVRSPCGVALAEGVGARATARTGSPACTWRRGAAARRVRPCVRRLRRSS